MTIDECLGTLTHSAAFSLQLPFTGLWTVLEGSNIVSLGWCP